MILDACKRGFPQGCRPIIFTDGCHVKTWYRGKLLCVVGIDPNDCIFTITIAVVEVEDTSNWTWFLQTLKDDLDIANTNPWAIMCTCATQLTCTRKPMKTLSTLVRIR
jgi:hypothetical protein